MAVTFLRACVVAVASSILLADAVILAASGRQSTRRHSGPLMGADGPEADRDENVASQAIQSESLGGNEDEHIISFTKRPANVASFWECGVELPWVHNITDNSTERPRVLVLLRGEVFRHFHCSHTGKKLLDCPDSNEFEGRIFQEQMEATRSHVKYLLEPLSQLGFGVDLVSSTYTLPDNQTESVMDVLANYTVVDWRARHRDDRNQYGTAWQAVYQGALYARAHNITYDQIVMLRHDMILKSDILATAVARNDDQHFLFPFFMTFHTIPQRCTLQGIAPDTLHVFPGKYWGCMLDYLKELWWPGENRMVQYLERDIGIEHLGAIVPVTSNSNPEHQNNPIYRFAMRFESDKDSFPCDSVEVHLA